MPLSWEQRRVTQLLPVVLTNFKRDDPQVY
jgi:hypothetical protein